jgi:hypothetical protein
MRGEKISPVNDITSVTLRAPFVISFYDKKMGILIVAEEKNNRRCTLIIEISSKHGV